MVPDVPPHSGVVRCVRNRRAVHVRHEVNHVRNSWLFDGSVLVRDLVLGLGGVVGPRPAVVQAQDIGSHPSCKVLQVACHSVTERILANLVLEVDSWWDEMLAFIGADHVQELLDEE